MYLFILQLTSQDKTPAVISRAMAKHNLDEEQAEAYELVQVISDERGALIYTNPKNLLIIIEIVQSGGKKSDFM